MASATATPEVAVAAGMGLEKQLGQTAPSTPEQAKHAKALAAELRQKGNEKGASALLENMAKGIKPGEVKTFVDKQMPDKDRKAGSAEEKRLQDLGVYGEHLRKIAEGEISSDPWARGQMELMLKKVPQLEQLLKSFRPATDKDAYLDGLMADARFSGILRSMLEQQMQLDGPAGAADIALKKKNEEVKSLAVQEQNKVVKDLESQLATVAMDISKVTDAALSRQVTVDSALRGVIGTGKDKLATFLKLDGNAVAKVDAYRKLRSDVADKKAELDAAIKAGNTTKEATLRGELTSIEGQMSTVNGSLSLEQKKMVLGLDETDRTTLETKQKDLESQRKDEKKKLDVAINEHGNADVALKAEQNKQKVYEEQLLHKMKGLVSEATLQYMQDRFAEADEANQTLLTKQIEEATDEGKKKLLSMLASRGRLDKDSRSFVQKLFRGKKVFDKDVVHGDYNKWMEKGPEGLMMQYLGITDMSKATEAQLALLKDPELQKDAVSMMFKNKMQLDGIGEDDVYRITRMPGGAEAMQKAMEEDTVAKGIIDQLRSTGQLDTSNVAWMKKHPNIMFAVLAALALGIGGAAIASGGLAVPLGTASAVALGGVHTASY